jgi:hypothetical protein
MRTGALFVSNACDGASPDTAIRPPTSMASPTHLIANWLRKLVRGHMDPISVSPSPCPFIFPAPSVSRKVIYDTPVDLQTKIRTDSNAVDHIGNIYVYSATFCKMKRGAQHEFLLFYIKDKLDDTKETVLLLDRVPQKEPSTQPSPQDVEAQGKVADNPTEELPSP